MLLDKLQFGFLLFETQQGLVKVELSFAQRIYLLWTFRNFRRLSIQLLNPRQRALVNSLFRRNAGVVSQLHKPLPAIGVVEDFAPPPMRMGASPVEKKERRDKVVAQRAENAADSALSSSPRVALSRLVTTVGALSLCIISVVEWHRIRGVPGSQAHNQPQLMNAITLTVPSEFTCAVRATTPRARGARPMHWCLPKPCFCHIRANGGFKYAGGAS